MFLVGFVLTTPPPVRTAARMIGAAFLARAALAFLYATPWVLLAVALFTTLALYASPQLQLIARLAATQVTARVHGCLRGLRAKMLGLAHTGPVMRRPRPVGAAATTPPL